MGHQQHTVGPIATPTVGPIATPHFINLDGSMRHSSKTAAKIQAAAMGGMGGMYMPGMPIIALQELDGSMRHSPKTAAKIQAAAMGGMGMTGMPGMPIMGLQELYVVPY